MEMDDSTGQVLFDKRGNDQDVELTHNEIWDDTLLIQQYDESLNIARRHLASKLTSVSSVTEDSECSNSHRTELVNGYPHSKSHSSNNNKKKKRKKGRKKNEWHTGDPCRACYSEDRQIYEATIVGINNARGTCTVRYLGYNNHEEVVQSSLLKSKGEGARRRQIKEVSESMNQSDESTDNESCGVASEVPTDNEIASTKNSREHTNMHAPPQQMPSRNSPSFPMKPEHSFPHIPNLPPPPALGLVDGPDALTSEALHTMLMSWYMTGYHTGYYQGLTHGRNNCNSKRQVNRNFKSV